MKKISSKNLNRSMFNTLKNTVQAWLSTSSACQDGKEVTEKSQHILRQMTKRWQREAPQQNIPLELAIFLQDMATRVRNNAEEKIINKANAKKLKYTLFLNEGPTQLTSKQFLENRHWLELELTHCIFIQLEILCSTSYPAWVTFFLELSSSNIASLISFVIEELIRGGLRCTPEESNIYQWMETEASFIKLSSFSMEQIESLGKVAQAIIDPVLNIIPEIPQFCLNSGGQLRVFDADTLARMQASDQNYRAVITSIDSSGPTGIEYVLTILTEDVPEVIQACDQILFAWRAQFPMNAYTRKEETEKQRELYFHERWLNHIDIFLDECIWNELPEEIHQIPDLEKQLEDKQKKLEYLLDKKLQSKKIEHFKIEYNKIIVQRRDLNYSKLEIENEDELDLIEIQLQTLKDDLKNLKKQEKSFTDFIKTESSKNLEAEIERIQAKLDKMYVVRNNLNVNNIKSSAIAHAQAALIKARESKMKWNVLLNFDKNDPAHVLTESQFISLVSHAVDTLVERNYNVLAEGTNGILSQHLAARREMQNEKRSNAEGSLRTLPHAKSELHQLSASEVRDPLDRKEFIDLTSSTNGSNFCDIIVGAWLCAIDHSLLEPSSPLVLPESIQEFITEKLEKESHYADRAKELFKLFRTNKWVLPPEQKDTLAKYGMQPVHSPDPILYDSTSRYSLLAQRGNVSHSSAASAPKTHTYSI